MNYEELYLEYHSIEKELKDKIAMVQKLYKAMGKEMESGDLKSYIGNISTSIKYIHKREKET